MAARPGVRGLARSTATRAGRARYLFDRTGWLRFVHYGEGEYLETELAIQERCARSSRTDAAEPMEPLRPEDAPGVLLEPQTADIALPADRERLELVRDWTDGEDWIEAADAGAAAASSFRAGEAYAVLSGAGRAGALRDATGRWRPSRSRPAPARRAVHARAASARRSPSAA